MEFQQIVVKQDDSSHWYVIPKVREPYFDIDLEDETMVDNGEFDAKWGKYRTGGDINNIQLWADIT